MGLGQRSLYNVGLMNKGTAVIGYRENWDLRLDLDSPAVILDLI